MKQQSSFLLPIILIFVFSIITCKDTQNNEDTQQQDTPVENQDFINPAEKDIEENDIMHKIETDFSKLTDEELSQILQNSDWYIKSISALSIGEYGRTDLIPDLILLLDDPHTEVKTSAMYALGDLNAVEAKDKISSFLESNNPRLSQIARYVLQKLNG
jgi:HEAT repeat protein